MLYCGISCPITDSIHIPLYDMITDWLMKHWLGDQRCPSIRIGHATLNTHTYTRIETYRHNEPTQLWLMGVMNIFPQKMEMMPAISRPLLMKFFCQLMSRPTPCHITLEMFLSDTLRLQHQRHILMNSETWIQCAAISDQIQNKIHRRHRQRDINTKCVRFVCIRRVLCEEKINNILNRSCMRTNPWECTMNYSCVPF